MILLSLCDFPWWLIIILLFLVAALVWLWMNSVHKNDIAEYKANIDSMNARLQGSEEAITSCKKIRKELESDLALTKGRMREMEAEMRRISGHHSSIPKKKKSSDKNSKKGGIADSSTVKPSMVADKSENFANPGAHADMNPVYAGIKSDNLQIIEGIGPKMEIVLKENGIDSHEALGGKSEKELRSILNSYGDRYKIIDPTSWATQAKLAAIGDFDSLIAIQKKLDGGKSTATGMTTSKLEKFLIKSGAMKAFAQNDLKAIEGIGPATDKLLQENGITTWRDLSNTSVNRLNEILNNAGSRFGLSDPTTWPKQAELAADGDFEKLREYQEFLNGGKE